MQLDINQPNTSMLYLLNPITLTENWALYFKYTQLIQII